MRRSCLISPPLSKNLGVSFLLHKKEKRECKGWMWTKHILKSLHVAWASLQHGGPVSKQETQEPARWRLQALLESSIGRHGGSRPSHCRHWNGLTKTRAYQRRGGSESTFNKKNVKELADYCNNHHGPTFNCICLPSSHMKLLPSSPETLLYSKQFYLSSHQV